MTVKIVQIEIQVHLTELTYYCSNWILDDERMEELKKLMEQKANQLKLVEKSTKPVAVVVHKKSSSSSSGDAISVSSQSGAGSGDDDDDNRIAEIEKMMQERAKKMKHLQVSSSRYT